MIWLARLRKCWPLFLAAFLAALQWRWARTAHARYIDGVTTGRQLKETEAEYEQGRVALTRAMQTRAQAEQKLKALRDGGNDDMAALVARINAPTPR